MKYYFKKHRIKIFFFVGTFLNSLWMFLFD